jgi:hypothetical protein
VHRCADLHCSCCCLQLLSWPESAVLCTVQFVGDKDVAASVGPQRRCKGLRNSPGLAVATVTTFDRCASVSPLASKRMYVECGVLKVLGTRRRLEVHDDCPTELTCPLSSRSVGLQMSARVAYAGSQGPAETRRFGTFDFSFFNRFISKGIRQTCLRYFR